MRRYGRLRRRVRTVDRVGTGVSPVQGSPSPDATAETTYDPLAALFDEATRDIPAEEWDRLPHDLAVNHDHYLFGTPKVKDAA